MNAARAERQHSLGLLTGDASDSVPASLRTVGRLFDVRPGEGKNVARAFVLLLLVIAGHTMFETARDSLFLTKLPPRTLNIVYVVIAALSFVAAAVSAFISKKLGAQRGLVVSLLACGIGGTAFWSSIGTGTGVFSFYVFTGMVGGILTPQFWTLAAQTFTPTQGRRLFGPLAAGGVAGGVVGAAGSALILSFVSIRWLLPVASSILVLAAIVAMMNAPPLEPAAPPKSIFPRESPVTAVKDLTKQRLMPRIAALVALSTACVLALDYLFKTTAAHHFQSTASLGRFFGWYYAILNLAGLIFQLFAASRAVQRFGVIGALGITPMLLFLGGAVTFVSGSVFPLVLLTRGIDGALRYSLHRVTMELLYLPVPPAQRTASKLFIDTVLMRVAQAAMAVILYVGAREMIAGPHVVAAIVAATAFAWLVVGISIRRPYLELFRHALSEGAVAPLPHTGTTVELDLDSAEVLVQSLGSRDVREVVAALVMLSRARRIKLIPSLILYHDSEEVLTRALTILGDDSARKDWFPLAERLLDDPREGVRLSAIRALTRRGNTAGIEHGRTDKSPRIAGYAAFYDALTDETTTDLRKNERLAFHYDPNAIEARRGLVEAIADSHDPRIIDLLLEMFRGARPAMMTPEDAALGFRLSRAMQNVDDPRVIAGAIAALPSRARRGPVRELLVSKGEPAFTALVNALFDPATPRNVKLHIPRTISRFRTQRACDVLVDVLASSLPGSVRYKALRGLGRLTEERDVKIDRRKIEFEIKRNMQEHARALAIHYVLSSGKKTVNGGLLADFFADKYRQARERAFRLLKIAYKHNEVEVAYRAISTDDPIARANAVEYIDVLLAGPGRVELRQLFALSIEDIDESEAVARARELVPRLPKDAKSALRELSEDKDRAICALARNAIAELGGST